MNNKDFYDATFEEMFRLAVIKNHEKELADIPSEEELKKVYSFSERHNERMRKLLGIDDKN